MRARLSLLVAALLLGAAVLVACNGSSEPDATVTAPPTATGSPEPTSTAASATAITPTGAVVAGTATIMPEPSGSATATATVTPTPAPTMEPSGARLKYVLFERFGRPWYCDPDFYPVARQDEQVLAEERFAEIEADAETFSVILGALGYAPAVEYAAAQQLAVYRDWKMLRALQLDPAGDGHRFDAIFTHDEQTGVHVEGTIDADGRVNVVSETEAGPPMCPICLARGTRIATPHGPIPVEELRVGMTVWTADANGRPEGAEVLAVGSTPVPASHQVIRLVLADGRELRASASHPLADGRLVGVLLPGGIVDGSSIATAEPEPYEGGATFDLLPTGPTGTYWAEGIPLGSTLVDHAGDVRH